MKCIAITCVLLVGLLGCGSDDEAGAVKVNADGYPYVQGEYLRCSCQLRSGLVCYDPGTKSLEGARAELDQTSGGQCTCEPTTGCGSCEVALVTARTGVRARRNADGTWPEDPSTLEQEVAFAPPAEIAAVPHTCR